MMLKGFEVWKVALRLLPKRFDTTKTRRRHFAATDTRSGDRGLTQQAVPERLAGWAARRDPMSRADGLGVTSAANRSKPLPYGTGRTGVRLGGIHGIIVRSRPTRL